MTLQKNLQTLSPRKKKEVVDDILNQFQSFLDNSLLISLGRLAVEGPKDNPTKTMADVFEMGMKP